MHALGKAFGPVVVTLVAATVLSGCVNILGRPQESTNVGSGSPPTLTAVRNDAWRVSPDGNDTYKLIVLDVVAHGELSLDWHDITLDTKGVPLVPTSAYLHPPHDWMLSWVQPHPIHNNQTIRVELHYHSSALPRIDHGVLEYVGADGKTALVTFALPTESPAP